MFEAPKRQREGDRDSKNAAKLFWLYIYYWILTEKSTTKAIAFVDKIDYMQQRRHIVVKALGKQIDVVDPRCVKYVFISFHHLDWLLISVNVTIYRNVLPKRYQSNIHFITTSKLWSCIKLWTLLRVSDQLQLLWVVASL